MKLNHQWGKYSKNINHSDIILYCHENNCRAHLETKLTTVVTRYPISKRIKKRCNLETTSEEIEFFSVS